MPPSKRTMPRHTPGRPRRSRAPRQLSLPLNTHGGKRPGAGRKPRGEKALHPHRTRPAHPSRCPAHVTLRFDPSLPNLRQKNLVRALFACLRAGRERLGCRIAHFSVQRSHVHLVVEAQGKEALSRGVQGLSIRMAKAVNRVLKRKGRVIEDRFHARALRTPKEVRAALSYVMCNARRHGRQRGRVYDRQWMDPCGSGEWFDGWKGGGRREIDDDAPVAECRTWLLRTGWRRWGLVSREEVPGPGP